MKKKILSLSMVLAMLALLAMPTAAFAAQSDDGTTVVTGSVGGPSIEVTAPGAVALGELPYSAVNAQQVVATSNSSGSVTVTNLRHRSYKVEVSGSSAKLTGTLATTLSNDLQIATGSTGTGNSLGKVEDAVTITPIRGDYDDPNDPITGVVVPVTVGAQLIKGGILSTAPAFVLALTAFQKVNLNESLTEASYSLTLTYTATITP